MNVRIIAATNRNLEEMIANGQFREDLYYRLKVVTLWLPPLVERPGDIAKLAEYYIAKYSSELGIENPGIDQEAMDTIDRLPWPGNIRELSNILQKALIFNRGTPLGREDILNASGIRHITTQETFQSPDRHIRQWIQYLLQTNQKNNLFEEVMDQFGSLIISEALNYTSGNRSRAAKLLNLSRPTLHSKIEKYNITISTVAKKESAL